MADASRFYAACWEEIEKDRGEFMKLKRLIFLILGFVCLGLGCVGLRAYFAYGTLFPGDGILFRKLVPKTP